jgi:hypothetical protein
LSPSLLLVGIDPQRDVPGLSDAPTPIDQSAADSTSVAPIVGLDGKPIEIVTDPNDLIVVAVFIEDPDFPTGDPNDLRDTMRRLVKNCLAGCDLASLAKSQANTIRLQKELIAIYEDRIERQARQIYDDIERRNK